MAGKRSRELRLVDGIYIAKCRERSVIAAATNGHSQIWPEAEMVVQGERAVFKHDGKKVWSCNTAYAALHFDISSLPKV